MIDSALAGDSDRLTRLGGWLAQASQQLEREYSGVVAVIPRDLISVGAPRRHRNRRRIPRTQLGVAQDLQRIGRLQAKFVAGCARAGITQLAKRDGSTKAVAPIDDEPVAVATQRNRAHGFRHDLFLDERIPSFIVSV